MKWKLKRLIVGDEKKGFVCHLNCGDQSVIATLRPFQNIYPCCFQFEVRPEKDLVSVYLTCYYQKITMRNMVDGIMRWFGSRDEI